MQKFLIRRDVLIASIVFLLALVVRLVFIWQWNATPYGAVPNIDAHAYDLWAEDIAHGQILRAKAFYPSPLYPYVLALLYKLFGHSFLAASLFNALLGGLTCAVLSLITLDCFGLEAAILTGALAVLDRQFIFYTAPVMKESFGLFLTALLLAAVLRALRSGGLRYFALSGALLGLLALVRGNALLLAPAIVLLAYIKRGRQSLGSCGAFALATILLILPATIHNAIVSHDFVFMNYDGGFNLYLGNSPLATGVKSHILEGAEGLVRERMFLFNEEEGSLHFAEQVSGQALRPSEVSAFWRNKALDFIVQNPRQSLSLLLEKFCLFWNSGELPDNYNITFITKNFPTILSLPLSDLWLVSVAAAFSLVGHWRRQQHEAVVTLAILAGVYMLSVLLFYVNDRLRLPIEVFLLPLAGAALPCAWELVHIRYWGRFMDATAFVALFLIVELAPGPFGPMHDDPNTAYNCGILGSIYIESGEYQDALPWLRKGAEGEDATAQGNLGVLYYKGAGVPRDYTQAMQWFRKAAEQGDANAQYNLGLMYYKGEAVSQDYAQAMQWFRKAADQGLASAQSTLGVMYYVGNGVPRDIRRAAQWFRKAADQGDANAQGYLEVLSHASNSGPQN